MKKKKANPFLRILGILFVFYVGIVITRQTGYYEKSIRDKTIMTEKQIAQFEKDLKENQVINVKEYLPKEEDYSNVFTKSANEISRRLGKLISNKSKNILDFLKTLFIG